MAGAGRRRWWPVLAGVTLVLIAVVAILVTLQIVAVVGTLVIAATLAVPAAGWAW